MSSRVLLGAVIAVVASMTAFGATSPLTLSPATLSFTYQAGSATLPAAQTVKVTTTPTGANFSLAVTGSPFNAAWLLVSATSGKAPASIKVQVNPTGLPAGTYTATMTFTAVVSGATQTQTVAVSMAVTSTPATISATPASLNFTYTTGDPIPHSSLTSALVLASSGGALTATVSVKNASWLTVTPTGNITLMGLLNTLTVTVDPTGLTSKVYTAQILVSAPSAANKTLTIDVTLTVNAAPPTVTGTWPAGLMRGSPSSTVTVIGSGYYSTSTVSATGFTPAATITVSDGSATASETFYIPVYQSSATGLRLAVASPLPSGRLGVAYSQTLAAAGGTAPYTYTLDSGLLPAGLSITGGAISGTPAGAGSYSFVVKVTDSSTPARIAFAQLKLTVDPGGATALRVTVAASKLGLGTVGTAYGTVTLTAAGGTGGPYTWTATDLPAGLTLSSAGVLSGTPTTDGAMGALTATAVGDTSVLVTVPAADLATAGILRMAVTTPAPGGGTSNETQFQVYGPEPQVLAITNAASMAQGTVSPGEVITIFGLGLGPDTLTIFDPSTPPIPTSLPSTGSATSVSINGTAAPVLYTSATQVSVIVPYTISGSSAQVIVTYGSLSSQAYSLTVAPTNPGLYSLTYSGQGPGAILNYNSITGDYTVNSGANAALRGSTVVIYMTGAGATTSTDYTHLVPLTPAVTPLATPTVTIGGQDATVQAAQAPPGSVPGLLQLNVTVPANIPASSASPVVVTIGGVSSQTGLTMAVK